MFQDRRLVLVAEVIQKEAADAVLFIQQALGLASVNDVWESNVYDFCRLFQQAKAIHEEKVRQIEKAKAKKR